MNHSFHSKKNKTRRFRCDGSCPRTGGLHTRQCSPNCGKKKCRSIDFQEQQNYSLKQQFSMEAAIMRKEKQEDNSFTSQVETSNYLKPINHSKDNQSQSIREDIEEIVDEDINGHGIFSLLKIRGQLQKELEVEYALSNLTIVSYACKKCIKQDLQTASMLANTSDDSQLGFIQMNSQIMSLIIQKINRDDQFGNKNNSLKLEE